MLRRDEPLYAPETPIEQCVQTYLLMRQLLCQDLARYPQPPLTRLVFLHDVITAPAPILVCPQ